MPKLKVDHVVSFSTEDPVHVASNVLSSDCSKKWKCQSTGEKSAVIVLQLEKASVISSIDIGNEHSAYVEVLVLRSGTTDDFRVLLVMSSFMSPLEARQSTNTNKVRMFTYNELQSPERDQKWDRVKIVCTQPFNRHVQYGLSFVTLHYLEAKDSNAAGQVKLGNFALRPKSPDILSVGSLFARRKELTDEPLTAAAAIREASSRTSLGQGSPHCKPRLKDTMNLTPKKDTLPNSNRNTTGDGSVNADTPRSRNRHDLLYSKDEEEPNQKIDKLIEQKNKEARERREHAKEEEAKKKQKKQKPTTNSSKHDEKDDAKLNVSKDPGTSSSSSTSNKRDADQNKRKLNGKDTSHNKKIKVDRRVKPFNQLLSGVMIVISGIQNPERTNIRTQALALGAKYKADWEDSCCTHLICAFTNTPKFNQVKGKGKIVNRIWIQDCYNRRKRLPWRRYALDIKDQNVDESEDEIWEQKAESSEMQIINNRSHEDLDDSTDAEDECNRSQTLQKANDKLLKNCFSVDTDEESSQQYKRKLDKSPPPELPDFLSNQVVYIDQELSEKTRKLLARYITAFNGILVDDPGDVVDFAISSPKSSQILRSLCPDAQVLSPEWIWECHNEKQLLPFAEYQL